MYLHVTLRNLMKPKFVEKAKNCSPEVNPIKNTTVKWLRTHTSHRDRSVFYNLYDTKNRTRLMDHLHWQYLLAKPPVTATGDST